jgi:hypothetical protein
MGFFDSWQFRTSRPSFGEGDHVELYASGFDESNNSLFAQVGDTRIDITNGEKDLVDRRIKVEIKSFDASSSTGKAELLEIGARAEF